jgi:hypothetical protein
MMNNNNMTMDYILSCTNKCIEAMEEKYKTNKQPHLAALSDPDEEVRLGAAVFSHSVLVELKFFTPGTRPSLEHHLKQANNKYIIIALKLALKELDKLESK